MLVKCPRCGIETAYEGNSFRPFCGENCKMIDLGRWMTAVYRVPAAGGDEEDLPPTAPSEACDP